MQEYFTEFLNAYWLRPETALWRALDIKAMQKFEFISPSLDLGCGDGIFSFIRAQGKFTDDFDVFDVGDLDKFFEGEDVYDHFDASKNASIKSSASYKIDVAFDHKENLLKKAGRLGLYNKLKLGDANQRLPFEDNSFKSIFSNIVYWLDDSQATLVEIHRILQPSGKACLMLPNSTLPEFSFYHQLYVKTGNPQFAFLEKLDRGRFSENIKSAKSAKDWEIMFSKAGLKVHSYTTHLSKTAIQIWDIGMRPLFPVLCKMTSKINKNELLPLKKEWRAIFEQFLLPIILMDDALKQDKEAAFHCYILEK